MKYKGKLIREWLMQQDEYEEMLVQTYVPNAEYLDWDDAVVLAYERDRMASEEVYSEESN
jgi:hypothetical protein